MSADSEQNSPKSTTTSVSSHTTDNDSGSDINRDAGYGSRIVIERYQF